MVELYNSEKNYDVFVFKKMIWDMSRPIRNEPNPTSPSVEVISMDVFIKINDKTLEKLLTNRKKAV